MHRQSEGRVEGHHVVGHHGEGHHGEGYNARALCRRFEDVVVHTTKRTEREHKHNPTQARLGARGQEEGKKCRANMQVSTFDKGKVSGTGKETQKLGTDTTAQVDHKPQTKPNRRKRRATSEQGDG